MWPCACSQLPSRPLRHRWVGYTESSRVPSSSSVAELSTRNPLFRHGDRGGRRSCRRCLAVYDRADTSLQGRHQLVSIEVLLYIGPSVAAEPFRKLGPIMECENRACQRVRIVGLDIYRGSGFA